MSRQGRRDLQGVFEDLVRSHAASLWRFAYRLTGNHDDADDLMQATYLEAWKSLHTLRDPGAGRSWLSRILQRRFQRWLRQLRAAPPREREIDDRVDASEVRWPDLDLLDRTEQVQGALDALPAERRLVFLLVFLEGYTCREAAERLGIPVGTVLSRLHRARCELRVRLRQLHDRGARDADGEVLA